MVLLLVGSLSPWKFSIAQIRNMASPEASYPAADATLHEAPKKVWIRFDHRLNKEFSVIIVKDASGERISGRTKLDMNTRKTLTVELPALAPGDYRVYWSAISWDGPPNKGDYVFHLAPP